MKSIYLCVCLFLTHHNIWAHGYLYKCFISKKENKIYFLIFNTGNLTLICRYLLGNSNILKKFNKILNLMKINS